MATDFTKVNNAITKFETDFDALAGLQQAHDDAHSAVTAAQANLDLATSAMNQGQTLVNDDKDALIAAVNELTGVVTP